MNMDVVRQLIAAKQEYDMYRDVMNEAKKKYDHLALEVVPEALREAGIDSVALDGYNVHMREDLRANVPSALRGEFAATLRELGEDAIITEYVFPQTLTSWARERLEKGEFIPPQVDVSSVRRAVPRKK